MEKPTKSQTSLFLAAKHALLLAPVVGSVLFSMPAPAHAGFFEWLDNATTYNEDQRRPLRPQILPEGPPAPLLYDTRGGDRWNQYHRQDMVAVPYMNGSGTMVMRPRSAQRGALYGYVYDQNGNPILGPNGQPITGYELMQRRAALNKVRQTNGKLYIGEPDGFPSDGGDVDLGVKTRIGAPIEDWRNPQDGLYFDPQPGDFDYANGQRRAQYDGLNTYTTLPNGGQNGQVGLRPRNGGDGGFGQHFPDHYIVKKGDTLTEISEQDQIYGDWKLWPLIYDANRSQIKHPDLIYPDQRFSVPRDYTVDEADDARKHSLPPYGTLMNRR